VLTRIVFDLGLRRELQHYPKPLQKHLIARQSITTDPDVTKSLELGGLSPEEVDLVILSHVHYDHTGTPTDFPTSHFIVGNGSLELLRSGADVTKSGSHSYYEPDLLPLERTTELSQPGKGLSSTQNTLDLFSDGSVYIVDAPGHYRGT
jgi:glyoxylase-like metal-dependent hydrolase (beta-lactamase superfamily II)